jgi:hypothetical protein
MGQFKEVCNMCTIPIFMMILMAVIVYTVSLGFVIQHENVHKAINYNYGMDSEIYIDYWTMSGYTTSSGEKCDDNCRMLHSYNEIVSYNMDAMMLAIYGVGFLLLTVLLFIYMQFKIYNHNLLLLVENNG